MNSEPVKRPRDCGLSKSLGIPIRAERLSASQARLCPRTLMLPVAPCSGELYNPVSLVVWRRLRTFSLNPYISAALPVQNSGTFRIGPTLKGSVFYSVTC